MNRPLCQLVQNEERERWEKNQRLQQILKKRHVELQATTTVSTTNPIEISVVEETEDDQIQQKLLACSDAQWKCLENSQQAMCVAMNRRQNLIAVGEKEGRISIWDNTTIRVIIREFDPTLIGLPETHTETNDSEPIQTFDEDEDPIDDASASIEADEDGSMEADDEMMEEVEEEEEDRVPSLMTTLSIEELSIVKHSLKHVGCCVWTCDSHRILAACEEKGNKKGRLCIWETTSAILLSTVSFDTIITSLSPHPINPHLVLVCTHNTLPILLHLQTGEKTILSNVPIINEELTITVPTNSRQPFLMTCARYGTSGKWIYCSTSKSTVSILDAMTLECLCFYPLSVLIQFVDLCVQQNESAFLVTSSKGIHEFSIHSTDQWILQETRVYSTGAVRAPWSICCFSSDEMHVVGMPIVRHRHVGDNGLYTWHRTSGRVQHNLGVKDGINSIVWDRQRDAIIITSCIGSIFVLEHPYHTAWPGIMYPAGYRLINDNEYDTEALEKELLEQEETNEKKEIKISLPLDIFTRCQTISETLPSVENELIYLPSIPFPLSLKRQPKHQHIHIERHFGLGQSVFEPFKFHVTKQSSVQRTNQVKEDGEGCKNRTNRSKRRRR